MRPTLLAFDAALNHMVRISSRSSGLRDGLQATSGNFGSMLSVPAITPGSHLIDAFRMHSAR
jgi:hypothetical protein